MLTVKVLKQQLEQLIANGMGDRVVSFSKIDNNDDYVGDYVLARKVDTKDALEVAVYLQPFDPITDSELWDKVEAEGNARLDAESEG
jgi:hypothetical protein